MLLRLFRIFQRYADENLRLSREGQPADPIGRVDQLRLERNRLIIEGWTSAERIGVRLKRTTLWTSPELAAPGEALRGFTLDIPFEPGTPELLARHGGKDLAVPLAGFTERQVRLRRSMLWGSYIWALFGLLPQIRRWKLEGDLGAREVVKERLGLVPFSYAAELDPAVLAAPQAMPQSVSHPVAPASTFPREPAKTLSAVGASLPGGVAQPPEGREDAQAQSLQALRLPDGAAPEQVYLDAASPAPLRPQGIASEAVVSDPSGLEGATVVVPVYNAFDLLPEMLERLERHADRPLRIVLVEDCSTQPEVRPFLQAWASDPARAWPVRLLLNPENLGFVRAANRGLAEARAWSAAPVVLLNSDAFLPQGWTSRLLAPLSDPSVASVTPMSNDAEIFNVPVICRRGDLLPAEADLIDAAARSLNPKAAWADAPTGVGFCMAMSPHFLEQVPAFDLFFGRGYGEETDWCQRTRALGGRHIGIATLFVEHRGGISFGSQSKQALLERNGQEISRRYPGYDREVQEFIRSDPLCTARLALALSWAAARQKGPVPIWLAHAMGGGAENDLKRRIAAEIAQGGSAVVLRVGQGHRWKLELHSAQGLTQGLSNDLDLIRGLIARLPARRIIYSCGVGERDPVALPGLLLELAGRGENPLPGGPQPIEVLVHDFFPISPSYTLMGKDGAYHGLPRPGTPAGEDPAHRAARPGAAPVALRDWQAAWGRLMAEASRITAFSESSRAIFAEIWPQTAARIEVVPHTLLQAVPRIAPARGERPVLAVLGNIGLQKGAAVVQRLSRDLARDTRLGLVVIGQFDPAYGLAAPARIHGSYELQDLPGLVARYGITGWIIPSVWPETFSFTTHEALATGMPVFAFDLGAQGDALRRALAAGAPGALLPLGPSPEIRVDDILRHLSPVVG